MGAVKETRPASSAGPTRGGPDDGGDGARSTHPADVLPAMPLRMPPPHEGEPVELREALRNFCFAGGGKLPGVEDAPAQPLHPVALPPWVGSGPARCEFPLYLPRPEEEGTGVTPLAALVETVLDESEAGTAETTVLRDQLWRLAGAAARELRASGASTEFHPVVTKACESFLAEFETSKAGRQALNAQLEQLVERLPGEGTLLGLGPHTLLALYGAVLRGRRESARQRFRDKVKTLISQLENQLHLDRMHSPRGNSTGNLRESMGDAAGSFVDSDALAGLLPPHRGTRPLDPQRRLRIEQTVDVLTGYLASEGTGPEFVLVHSGDLPEELQAPDGSAIRKEDSFAAGVSMFDEIMEEILPVLRAVRTAQLESAGRYEPAVHDELLARLDRHSLTADEWAIPRAVVVLEFAGTLESPLFYSFSRLLHSGRPIHVLVLHEPMGRAGPDFGGCDPGLGYRSIAHRKAFVMQSTLTRPGELAAGLRDMVRADGPAVAFVGAVPWAGDDAPPWRQSVAEHQARALPCFSYAPDAGTTLAARFDLSQNPQPGQIWPRYSIAYLDPDGSEQELNACFTFADFAAMHPSSRDQFWVLSPAAWDDDQIELSEFLVAMGDEQPRSIPFVWVCDGEGLLRRAAVGRELIIACLERMDFWHTLQELAGIDSEYARRAAEKARAEAGAALETERKERDATHAADMENVRAAAEKSAVDRLVAVLMGIAGGAAVPIPAAPGSGEPVAETAPQETVEDEEADREDPWMETALCTTCDECIKINPSIFAYNDNKQAYLTDAQAASFADLVKAAELCPAHCIHPGAPRAGDATATDALRSKAAKLN